MEPLRPPVQIGEVTEEELKAYDGSDPEKPLLMAIKGQIYDVSQSRRGCNPTHVLVSVFGYAWWEWKMGRKASIFQLLVDTSASLASGSALIRMFYGPGGPYALFAGKDASRALAKMSFEEKDLTGDISGLGPFEVEALQDWEYKFMGKYVKVGTVKKTVPVTEPESTGEAAESNVHDAESSKPTEDDGPSESAAAKNDGTPSKIDADKE
ncbi:Membrane steroid-binding protein 2 [Glycine soja]|uniref:Membrane steroid-binding protein 2 n=1 Tax=Glycine soja TaxID=3848 RepID=A0A0B2RHP8_GLYSO|nr:Membrane steroid-binding protein 2 [Glycine soja]